MNNPDFDKVDWSHLKVSVAGGMALQKAVADKWTKRTKTLIIEGYGLTETAPVASANPLSGNDKVGTIGLPLPSTEFMLMDENGNESKPGEAGEICIRGPQVMKGYCKIKPKPTTSSRKMDGLRAETSEWWMKKDSSELSIAKKI